MKMARRLLILFILLTGLALTTVNAQHPSPITQHPTPNTQPPTPNTHHPSPNTQPPKRIAVVLSGGGAKGVAHIGVLRCWNVPVCLSM